MLWVTKFSNSQKSNIFYKRKKMKNVIVVFGGGIGPDGELRGPLLQNRINHVSPICTI